MRCGSGGDRVCLMFFFFNDTATTEIYTLSLHDALPISAAKRIGQKSGALPPQEMGSIKSGGSAATRNWAKKSGGRSEEHTSELQSHVRISYAVFCLKKKTRKR